MTDIIIRATEIDRNKKYVFMFDERVGPQDIERVKNLLADAGFTGLVFGSPMTIVDYDQIKGYLTSSTDVSDE